MFILQYNYISNIYNSHYKGIISIFLIFSFPQEVSFMNVPNILTIFRLLLIPVFVIVFFSSLTHNFIFAILIFLIAGATDFLDGYIARKYKLVTDWGTILDPFADKLMLFAVLSCLVISSYIPLWVLLVVLAKDLFMIIMGTILYTKGTIIPSNIFGKVSTIFFYLSILIFSFDESIGLYLIYISVASAILALSNYFVVYSKNHKGTLKKNKTS